MAEVDRKDAHRIRATLLTIILVALGLGGLEAGLAITTQSAGLWVLAIGTGGFALALVPPYRSALRAPAWSVFAACLAILGIQLLYIFAYPAAYAAITIASVTIVALALSFISGRTLFIVTMGAWTIAMTAVLWGTFGEPGFDIPSVADRPIVVGSGIAAVTVAMVMLLQFATRMTQTVHDARSANKDLVVANQKLATLDRMKSQFINSAAHELNTPMTPVMIQLKLLRDGKTADASQRRSMEVLERNLKRINLLVREMLDVARMQSKASGRTDAVHMRPLLEDAVQDYVGAAQGKGLLLTVLPGPDAVVRGDAVRIAQVLSNLLSNAVKMTDSGGQVLVTLHLDSSEAVVQVRDTGAGLSQDQRDQLFQPFGRVHEDRGLSTGTGLGLYISRGIVEAMGGRLWAESDGPGRGATFAFAVPAAAMPPPMHVATA